MNYKLKKLVEAAKDGSPAAQMELLDRLKPLLLFTLKRCAWGMDWEEMMQEASLEVLEAVRDYRESTGVPFLAYLKARLAFHIYNQSRKQRVAWSRNISMEKEEDGQNPLDRISDESADPPGDLLQREQRAAVRSAVDQLDPVQKQIILLHYYQGKSLKSIARNQGVCYKTALRRRDKALKSLAALLHF